ncbi:MAG: adenylate/guanylate cyclase domain-containing protein [Planctomycetia bacterium]|nr:adenylate/guanylate cyclase domain-containing protein [Planctomycetia bacterium]
MNRIERLPDPVRSVERDFPRCSIADKFYVVVSRLDVPLHPREVFDEPVELGRQNQPRAGEVEPIFAKIRAEGRLRFVLCRGNEETHIHRRHLRLECTGPSMIRVTNIGPQNPIGIQGHESLATQQTGEYRLPITLQLCDISIQVSGEAKEIFESLTYRSFAPRSKLSGTRITTIPAIAPLPTGELENLGRWLEAVLEVLQSATGKTQFYEQAARALVELAGLDHGAVLMKVDDQWVMHCCYPPQSENARESWTPSRSMLKHMEETMTAIGEIFGNEADMLNSVTGIRQLIAAPIISRDGVIKGALYGERRSVGATKTSVYELLAVKLLAGGVANGIARLEIEEEAAAAHKMLETFFTKELADELMSNAKLLEGKDTEVTLLFADVKAFSTITERLGAQATMRWMNDVLTVLSECVLQHGGVVIDFIGDELFAMFGAPKHQPDHAMRACRAAVAMSRAMASIDERWQAIIAQRTQLSIGINSGTSRVGNTGSDQRFKYGALGPDVNLASRVRGATKYLRTDLIVTDSTMAQLGEEFRSRRLCRVKVINIERPVDLFEIFVDPPESWQKLKTRYEHALYLFESQDFMQSSRELGQLFTMFAEDGPSLQLLSRAVTCLVNPDADRDPVWRLPGK